MVYQLKENLCEPIDKISGDSDSSGELVNRKIQLHESAFDRLDREAEALGISRAKYVRNILQYYWDNPEVLHIRSALNDTEEKIDELQEYVRPETDEEYREAGRLLRAIRNHLARIEEEVAEQ